MIRLTQHISLVGSGREGIALTHPIDCHVYLIDASASWVLIDAGSGADTEKIVDSMRASETDMDKPGTVLLTHGHADHSGGAAELSRLFPHAEIFAGAPADEWIRTADAEKLSVDRGIASGAYPEGFAVSPCPQTRSVRDGHIFDLGDVSIRAIGTPGHAAGHMAYLLITAHEGKALFTGDCVFAGGKVSVQNLHDTDIPAYSRSLERLAEESFTSLFPGHGCFSLTDGEHHVKGAHESFRAGRIPASIA